MRRDAGADREAARGDSKASEHEVEPGAGNESDAGRSPGREREPTAPERGKGVGMEFGL